MNVIVSGRHVSVTDGMKSHLQKKLDSILDDFPLRITSARAILDVEKNSRHKVEIIIHLKRHEFEATSQTYDMYESIDGACEKMEKQLMRYLDKLHEHKSSLKEMELAASSEKNEVDFELEMLEKLIDTVDV